MDLKEHEIRHLNILDSLSSECTLFLKRNNDFPLEKLDNVALYGNGVRRTLKGGTGSGNVDIHIFKTVEEVFIDHYIEVTSRKWLDAYDNYYEEHQKDFIQRIKKEAKAKKTNTIAYSVGYILEEGEYDLPIDDTSEVAIYVLSRNAGEGGDRKPIKGDYYLTDSEIRDIHLIANRHKKFLLVLNIASPIDLTPVLDIKNILLLSQLGSLTSETLFDIVFGNKNPSGKLSTTLAKLEDYPAYNEFGDINDTLYKEGIYVGYRYFDTFDVKPMFEFGYGLSYTNFSIKVNDITKSKTTFIIEVKVKNIGEFKGKEVVQLYLRKPSQKLDNPHQILVNFAKTRELKPKEEDTVILYFDICDFPSFNPNISSYVLDEGIYNLAVGNSSRNLDVVASYEIPDEIVIKKVKEYDDKVDFELLKNPLLIELKKHKKHFEFAREEFRKRVIDYHEYQVEVPALVSELSNKELTLLACGDIKGQIKSLIGESCSKVVGGAGETCLKIEKIPEVLSMCDGPAGIRITKEYVSTKRGIYKISTDPLWRDVAKFLPKILRPLLDNSKNSKKKGEIHYQYTTSIPVATALAQSFNDKVLIACGEIIKNEMELFNVDLWLAPAMNIHRNILCGRNFEYYSEDPYLTSVCASALVNKVQEKLNKGVVVKHFACNNQELNRTNNNSRVSIRALREIYLAAFEKTIKNSRPDAVMMSYNIVNGEHTSESHFLTNDILRNEWRYEGMLMTDWITTGQIYYSESKYPCAYASKVIKNGTNLCMPGGKSDIKDIKNALKNRELTRQDLLNNAAIIYRCIKKIKCE